MAFAADYMNSVYDSGNQGEISTKAKRIMESFNNPNMGAYASSMLLLAIMYVVMAYALFRITISLGIAKLTIAAGNLAMVVVPGLLVFKQSRQMGIQLLWTFLAAFIRFFFLSAVFTAAIVVSAVLSAQGLPGILLAIIVNFALARFAPMIIQKINDMASTAANGRELPYMRNLNNNLNRNALRKLSAGRAYSFMRRNRNGSTLAGDEIGDRQKVETQSVVNDSRDETVEDPQSQNTGRPNTQTQNDEDPISQDEDFIFEFGDPNGGEAGNGSPNDNNDPSPQNETSNGHGEFESDDEPEIVSRDDSSYYDGDTSEVVSEDPQSQDNGNSNTQTQNHEDPKPQNEDFIFEFGNPQEGETATDPAESPEPVKPEPRTRPQEPVSSEESTNPRGNPTPEPQSGPGNSSGPGGFNFKLDHLKNQEPVSNPNVTKPETSRPIESPSGGNTANDSREPNKPQPSKFNLNLRNQNAQPKPEMPQANEPAANQNQEGDPPITKFKLS